MIWKIIYTHEMGKFEKEPNRVVGKDYIFGDFCFVGITKSEEVSLTDFQIKVIKEHLANNKWCPICGNDIIGRPALSRQIKGLNICGDCGEGEAMAEIGFPMPTNKIIEMIKAYRK